MADFKYIMQGFQKDINFFDEIKEVLETEDYTSIWILTAQQRFFLRANKRLENGGLYGGTEDRIKDDTGVGG